MKKIEIEIPEGKKAEWVNDVLTLVDDKPIEYKFNVGDKVMVTAPNSYPQDAIYEIVELKERDGEPLYEMKCKDGTYKAYERYIKLAPQDITERIKTFEDAYKWCRGNGNIFLCSQYERIIELSLISIDLLAYLKLRIITCALNEGWKPKLDGSEENWRVEYNIEQGFCTYHEYQYFMAGSSSLVLKSEELANYASKQFADFYADFFGCKKGGKK